MILGNIASVATLILFVFYFIGRIITIVRNRYVFTDELRMMGAGFDPLAQRYWLYIKKQRCVFYADIIFIN